MFDNVLKKDECDQLITMYESNKEKTKAFGEPSFYPLNFNLISNNFTIGILNKIEQLSKMCNEKAIIDWAEIVKWIPETYMGLHKDTAESRTILTSVLYLNDDYEGGSTYFTEGANVTPVTGRMVVFDGTKYEHGVSKIKGNTRYTLPIWYKLKE